MKFIPHPEKLLEGVLQSSNKELINVVMGLRADRDRLALIAYNFWLEEHDGCFSWDEASKALEEMGYLVEDDK